jgi:two-component system, NarL family, response regulator DegU
MSPLTRRKREVLQLLVKGLANKQIGRTLAISLKTVEKHMLSIFRKLKVYSRTEAAVTAVRLRILNPEE